MKKLKDGSVRVSIPTKNLLPDLRIPFDVSYVDKGEQKLLFRKWTLIDETLLSKLRAEGILSVFLEGDPNYIKDYLVETNLDETVSEVFLGELALEEAKQGFHEVERSLVIDKTIIPDGASVSFTIFEIVENSIMPVLEASAINPAAVSSLIAKTKGSLLIRESDIGLYQNYLADISLQGGPNAKRIQGICLRENAKIVVRKYVTRVSSSFDLSAVSQTAEQIAEALISNTVHLADIYREQSSGFFPYSHAVNVCGLSIGLARKLERNEHFIRKLALGALLHDIGKLALPKEVALKLGELTKDEYVILRQHPTEGVKMLSQVQGVPQEVLLAVLQHHEKHNGSGYPLGYKADKLSHYGRAVSLANSFDALTSLRPHKYALSPSVAATAILKEARDYGDFDPDEAKAFARMIFEMASVSAGSA